MITIDLRKPKALDADPKTIHQSNLAGNVEQAENTITLFILEETKVTIFYFSKEYCEWLLRTKYCVYYKFILVGHIFMIKMTQYNSIHLKLSNSLFKKLKSTT